jgi:hypothetical protein
MRELIDRSKMKEDVGMLPTSLLQGIPDDLMRQLGFFLNLATRLGWNKAAQFLRSVMQR